MKPDWYVYSTEEYDLDNIYNDEEAERATPDASQTGMANQAGSNVIWYT